MALSVKRVITSAPGPASHTYSLGWPRWKFILFEANRHGTSLDLLVAKDTQTAKKTKTKELSACISLVSADEVGIIGGLS